jgi:hypothetical protein
MKNLYIFLSQSPHFSSSPNLQIESKFFVHIFLVNGLSWNVHIYLIVKRLNYIFVNMNIDVGFITIIQGSNFLTFEFIYLFLIK